MVKKLNAIKIYEIAESGNTAPSLFKYRVFRKIVAIRPQERANTGL